MEGLTTPVLLIAFNRPDTASAVFETIRRARPQKLFMFVDAPRTDRPEETVLCEETKSIIKKVDWPCDVHTLFPDENLGAGRGPAKAITWFFENVESGIILEDDCVPNDSFFKFSEEMLERYKDDERIMVVSGNNFQEGHMRGDASYYFSVYPNTWGWATWRRAWKHFSYTIEPLAHLESIVGKEAIGHWDEAFRSVQGGTRKDVWDYQWVHAVWTHKGLSVVPNKNLVSNIGHGEVATHTKKMDTRALELPREEMLFPLVHPSSITSDKKADQFLFKNFFQRNIGRRQKIKNFIQRLI
ncbi:MAG: hypothetical protein V4465_00080 [Patescibacteria group bacterium]